MATPTYTPPKYDETKYRKGISTDFYDQAKQNFAAQAEKNRTAQLGEAQKTQQSALRQAYLTRVQNDRNLTNSLATAGIRGGATETSRLNVANQYGQAMQAANTDYTNSVNSINQNIDQQIFDYNADMDSRAEQYRQTLSQARWQADREDALAKYNSLNEYWNNYYLDYYSGYGKKKLNKELKKAKRKAKNAKTQAEKIRYQQMIRGIQNRRGVIKNK